MFRMSGRRPPATLDEATVERLLDGTPIDDLPDALRPLGEVLAGAKSAPTPEELVGSTAAAAAFVTARAAAGRTVRRARSVGVSMFSVLLLAASTGTAVAATRGALPEPIQQVAHEALGVVGIWVPSINENHPPGDHGQPVVATNGSTGPAISPVSTPATVGATTSGTGGSTPATGAGSSGRGSTGNTSGEAPGDTGSSRGRSGETGPPETPLGEVDTPGDQGGGQSGGGDRTTSPDNRDLDQGNDPAVPPDQAKRP